MIPLPPPIEIPASEIVIEAEAPARRAPEGFARAHEAAWASNRQCLVAFNGQGECEWDFELTGGGERTLWLRYAAANDVTLTFEWAGALGQIRLPSTGGYQGREVWGWAPIDRASLDAGTHTITLRAAALRPDCLVVGGEERPTFADPAGAAPLSEEEALRWSEPPRLRPDWLDEFTDHAPPAWYDETRLCVHTRYGPPWVERDLFTQCADRLHSIGVKSFVRHVRTRGEGQWWPSGAGVSAPWAESDPVRGMVERAHANGQRFIGYYRHLEDVAIAAEHPDWQCRDDLGQPLIGRNGDPRICINSPYFEVLEARLDELAALEVDGIYFDEDHWPREGCWCRFCVAGFEAESGMKMPVRQDESDPRYLRLLEFGAASMERTFARLQRRLEPALLIGSNRAPDLTQVFGSDRLWRIADGVKTEFGKGHGAWAHHRDDIPARDVWLALGWAFSRDAAEGRPPHVWCNGLTDPRMAEAAAAAVIAHGGVANLDVKEARMPDAEVFAEAVAVGNRMSEALAGARPLPQVLVHWPGAYLARLEEEERVPVAIAVAEAFEEALRRQWTVGILTDSQLVEGDFGNTRVIVVPAPEALVSEHFGQLEAHEGWVAFGDEEWHTFEPEVRVHGGPEDLHAILHQRGTERVLALVPNPGWIYTGPRVDRAGRPIRLPAGVDLAPPLVSGVTVEVPFGVTEVIEVVSGRSLPIEAGKVRVPDFQSAACLLLR